MSRVLDIIHRYYERYPDPGAADTRERYDLEQRQLSQYLRLTDGAMQANGVVEDVRAAVVRDLLYSLAGDPQEQQRRAAEQGPRVSSEAWQPPGNGSGWTGDHRFGAHLPPERGRRGR